MRRPILLALLMAAPCAAQETPALDAAQRRAVVDSTARVLEARYADSAAAVRLGAHLRGRLAAGAYDRIADPAALGAALTTDLQSVRPDKHLRFSYEPTREYSVTGVDGAAPASRGPGPVRWGRIDGRDSAAIARTNFAFDAVERLEGNVGYLRLSQFVPLDYSRETAVAAMAFLAHSDAVILDLRRNPGGSPELVELILSYFMGPEPVTFLTTYSRATRTGAERRTLREVPGQRMPEVPLYVLTSGNSGSAAETFAYAVQRLRRGTVVGETTAGAGTGGAKQSVGAGLALFVPQFQVTSGPGYERTGVTPDVPTPAADALAVAHRAALEALAARDTDPAVRTERAWALELVRATQAPAAEDRLERFAGTYGTRTVAVEGGRLVTAGQLGWKSVLVPLGGGVFRAGDARLRFETDTSGRARALVMETMSGTPTRLPRTGD
jgi:hypothetical protein